MAEPTVIEMNEDHLEGCACFACVVHGKPWTYEDFDVKYNSIPRVCRHCSQPAGKHHGGQGVKAGRCKLYAGVIEDRKIHDDYRWAKNSWYEEEFEEQPE